MGTTKSPKAVPVVDVGASEQSQTSFSKPEVSSDINDSAPKRIQVFRSII